MKLVAMHEAKAKLSEYVAVSQKDRVLITNHGKPAALVIGVEGESLEDLLIPDGAIRHALERTDVEGARIAEDLYGDDDEAELAALVAGTHPFQRRLNQEALTASKHQAAELTAVVRR